MCFIIDRYDQMKRLLYYTRLYSLQLLTLLFSEDDLIKEKTVYQ